MRRLALLLLLCLPALIAADTPQIAAAFKFKELNVAADRYTAIEQRAREDYERIVMAARANLYKSLEAGLNRATKAGDFDEAAKIKAAMQKIKDEVTAAQKAQYPFLGTWERFTNRGGITLTFEPGGRAVDTTLGVGRWQLADDKLVVEWPDDGRRIIFDALPDDASPAWTGAFGDSKETCRLIRKKGLTARP